MCGIAGILKLVSRDAPLAAEHHAEAIAEHTLDVLEQSIRHRGPDGRGRFRDAIPVPNGTLHIALIHRRLSIIDAAGGAQPMLTIDPLARPATGRHAATLARDDGGYAGVPSGEQHTSALVFNGCIYNHRQIRADLRALGHQFQTDHSDTESLLHACNRYGPDVQSRLDGMYAFAWWNSARGTLMLARDPAGEKPLYTLAVDAQTMLFGSSAMGLMAAARTLGWSPKPNPIGVALWLKHGYWPTMPVAGLMEVGPGEQITLAAQGSMLTKVARSQVPAPGKSGQAGAAPIGTGGWIPLLQSAVASRLEADVPLGCFLSGGVDSSVVAALAQRAMRSRGGTLKTFTVRMPQGQPDESEYAELVAKHLGTAHTTLDCAATAAADLVKLISQVGLPFGDSSLLPTHWVSRAAREHVTVALGGDGGDELFAGYNRYQAARMMHDRSGTLAITKVVPGWAINMLGGNLRRVATASKHAGYQDILTIFRTPDLQTLIPGARVWAGITEQYADRPTPRDARHEDFAHYLPEDLMRKVDTASMAVALEVRAPLLERGLVAAALASSMETVEAGEGRKGLLMQVARELVPRQAIDRKKQGFGVPIGKWISEDFGGLRVLAMDSLGSAEPFGGWLDGIVDTRAVKALVDSHFQGERDYGQRLFGLQTLSLWARAIGSAT